MAKRIRPAKHYQKPDNPQRKLILQHRRPVARDLRAALGHLGEMVPVEKTIQLIKDGRFREIKGEVNWTHFREILKKPFATIGQAWQDGAALGVRKINASFVSAGIKVRFGKTFVATDNITEIFSKALGDRFNFDLYNEKTQAALRAQQDDLIQQLEDTARDSIETIVSAGAIEGLSAEDIVGDIRSLIGLTDMQSQAVMNYENMLRTLDPTALQRQLRNTTQDETVQDAIDAGTMLDDDVIDELVDDYTDNYLDYRASTIAQTESSRAVNDGLHDAYSQAIDRGVMSDEAVTREWELGDSPCPICESIPDNNPDGVGVDEDFDSDDGPVDDPPVHPSCMCSVNYITDISMLSDESDDSGSFDTADSQADEFT